MATVDADQQQPNGHLLLELGLALRHAGEAVQGSADLVPQMWVPGSTSLRTSVLAIWADTLAGHVAMGVFAPRVPVTLELDIHLYEQLGGQGAVQAVARPLKAGRTVVVAGVDFSDDRGKPLAIGTASFMAAPDPGLSLPRQVIEGEHLLTPTGRLRVPLAERARCERREPGVAILQRSEDGLNSSNTVNGGLVALAVEEAALSVAPGTTVSSLAIRYLRPVRVGPAVASAEVMAGLGRVEVRDEGSENRLAALAMTRTFDR
jgi:acyl-coenzyme A thioesterase PaaI-like protein